jgi:hypothetical protein
MAAGFMPQMHILIFRFWLLASGYWLFAIDAQINFSKRKKAKS